MTSIHTAAQEHRNACRALVLTTTAFTVCFAVWVMNGPLVTFLSTEQVMPFTDSQVAALLAAPIVTGAISRVPLGLLTDRYGGRIVMTAVMLLCSIALVALSFATEFRGFMLASLAFGLAGGSFAVGVGFISAWYHHKHIGMALGIFGLGNAGATITTLLAPSILRRLTGPGGDLEQWRIVPRLYAGIILLTALGFYGLTTARKPSFRRTLRAQLRPLRSPRVWRFGCYYFLTFGAFVALAQWLVPYSVQVYNVDLVTAGLLASAFALPAGVVRVFGGWLSDRLGARKLMYIVFSACLSVFVLLSLPALGIDRPESFWIFVPLMLATGVATGIGAAAVFKFIPEAFPGEVGAAGGLVGLLGATGGFVLPPLFGAAVASTGSWSSTWVVLAIITAACVLWMHLSGRHVAPKLATPPAVKETMAASV